MRRSFLLALAVVLLSSCGPTATLYYWGGTSNGATLYENLAYKHYDQQTPESICKLICVYEDMVANPVGIRKVPPPGICAEYAYLLSQPEMVQMFIDNATPRQKAVFGTDDLAGHFAGRVKELFEMEMKLYPESVTFIRPLFTKIVGE